ncbi:MAG: SOS response-associated peptidase [Bacteroidota bacterium]
MCVDIGYKAVLGPNGLPQKVKGVRIKKEYEEADRDAPHLSAFARPDCWALINQDGTSEVIPLHWGLIADFMADRPDQFEKYGNSFFNARSERILERGSAWYPYITNRCLLIADGIYEHQKVVGRSRKMPWYVRLATGEPLLIPSLYNPRTQTVAMLTREGNDLFRTIHNDGANKFRMPLLLEPEEALRWIEPNLSESGIKSITTIEIPSERLQAHTVFSIRGNTLRPDGKEMNEAYTW